MFKLWNSLQIMIQRLSILEMEFNRFDVSNSLIKIHTKYMRKYDYLALAKQYNCTQT